MLPEPSDAQVAGFRHDLGPGAPVAAAADESFSRWSFVLIFLRTVLLSFVVSALQSAMSAEAAEFPKCCKVPPRAARDILGHEPVAAHVERYDRLYATYGNP
jgi:hypothetical protein